MQRGKYSSCDPSVPTTARRMAQWAGIIELRDDYSYAVAGHPKHTFLFIMSWEPVMSDTLYDTIVRRCNSKGYNVAKLKKARTGR